MTLHAYLHIVQSAKRWWNDGDMTRQWRTK